MWDNFTFIFIIVMILILVLVIINYILDNRDKPIIEKQEDLQVGSHKYSLKKNHEDNYLGTHYQYFIYRHGTKLHCGDFINTSKKGWKFHPRDCTMSIKDLQNVIKSLKEFTKIKGGL